MTLLSQPKPRTHVQTSPHLIDQGNGLAKQISRRFSCPWILLGKTCLRLIVLAAISALLWAGYLRVTGNIHTIEEGRAYRSAQLSPSSLLKLIADKKIQTVINLRGYNGGKRWYDSEVETTQHAGVKHVDLALSANQPLSNQQISRLLDLLKKSPEPILIHCEGGADRAGLAAAIYEFIVAERSPSVAGFQLSFRFGHFPWLGSRTVAMDQTWDRILANSSSINENYQWKRWIGK
jgi:protein tyrosine/serine phosphatase